MKNCSPKGRECIEKESSNSFNCRLSCEGIYADIQWSEEKALMELRSKIEAGNHEIENTKDDKEQRKGELLNKGKLANLLKKYLEHKQNLIF